MKNRIELAQRFAALGFKKGAEIGVYKGLYALELCKANPSLQLYCIDSWGMPTAPGKGEGVAHVRAFVEAQSRLAPYNVEFIKKFSMDAINDFEDGSLDFVYIDANHTRGFVAEDVREWSKKVRVGGIVAGHDYLDVQSRYAGVKPAVDGYVKKNNLELCIINEEEPSWYFIKP